MSVKRVNGLAVPTPPLAHRYVMDARFIAPADGDSFHLTIRLPFREDYAGRCRLRARERTGKDKPGGPEATDFTTAWLAEAMAHAPTLPAVERDWPLLVQGRNGEKFGRPLVEVWASATARTSRTTPGGEPRPPLRADDLAGVPTMKAGTMHDSSNARAHRGGRGAARPRHRGDPPRPPRAATADGNPRWTLSGPYGEPIALGDDRADPDGDRAGGDGDARAAADAGADDGAALRHGHDGGHENPLH
jgi:hypothetical protein